jgi:hypothetical protein
MRLKDDIEEELETMVNGPGEFTVAHLKQAVRNVTKKHG